MNKTGTENKSPTSSSYSDYSASQDKSRDYLKEAYKKELEWKKELRIKMANVNSGKITNSSNYNWSTITAVTPAQASILNINGNTNTVEVKTSLLVDGRDILKELDEMRDALLLLKRDVNMEAKYPRLKEIKDEYEQEMAKYKTFDTLKESK